MKTIIQTFFVWIIVFIYISRAALTRSRTLPSRCRRAWQRLHTFFECMVSYAADKSQKAQLLQCRRIHHRRISSDISRLNVSRQGRGRKMRSGKRAEACRRCIGIWHRTWCRTTSSFCLTSDALICSGEARWSWSRGLPTSEYAIDTCLGSGTSTPSCSRSMSKYCLGKLSYCFHLSWSLFLLIIKIAV